ncbi:hypothetical protein AO263_21605 [Pseudomonas sp. NZIPFR-PS5]|jgi:hypothetical protein|nr:hypothetical protein AO263_21605 [Pseudomonas sp. NZIPFR-PS5]
MNALFHMTELEKVMLSEARASLNHLRCLAAKPLSHRQRCEAISLEAEASAYIKLARYECGMSDAAADALEKLDDELAEVLDGMRRMPPKKIVFLVRSG